MHLWPRCSQANRFPVVPRQKQAPCPAGRNHLQLAARLSMKLRMWPQSEARPTVRSAYLQRRVSLAFVLALLMALAVLVFSARSAHTDRVASVANIAGVTLAPSQQSGQPVGVSIVWHAASHGLTSPVYQFIVIAPGAPARIVRDFSTGAAFTWTPLQEGRFTIQVVAKMRLCGSGQNPGISSIHD
jgi:hypothetical protein